MHPIDKAEGVVDFGEVGIDFNRSLEDGDGIVEFALLAKDPGEVVISLE